jgi:hypothetical protein
MQAYSPTLADGRTFARSLTKTGERPVCPRVFVPRGFLAAYGSGGALAAEVPRPSLRDGMGQPREWAWDLGRATRPKLRAFRQATSQKA